MQDKAKTILLVEDDAPLREALTESLQDEGYKVVPAADGQDALDWLSAASAMPQLIITDLFMPRVNGWDLWSHLQSKSKWETIPVFVLSGDLHARTWPTEVMPQRQLRKPPDLNSLLLLLADLMSTQQAASPS